MAVAGEHVDHASATDLRGRVAWRAVLDQAAKRRLDCIVVWKFRPHLPIRRAHGNHGRAFAAVGRRAALVLGAVA